MVLRHGAAIGRQADRGLSRFLRDKGLHECACRALLWGVLPVTVGLAAAFEGLGGASHEWVGGAWLR